MPSAMRRSIQYRNFRNDARRRLVTLRHHFRPRHWTDADPCKVIFLNPTSIRYATRITPEWQARYRCTDGEAVRFTWHHFHKLDAAGRALAGDWDRLFESYEANKTYRLIVERYGRCMPWRETAVFREFVETIERGEAVWHDCSSIVELKRRCDAIDRLFVDIRDRGYRPQSEFRHTDRRAQLDEIVVNIDREGGFLYNSSGSHRLSIAKVLGIDAVPVRILVRHREWQDLRNRIRSGSRASAETASPVPQFGHPDLADAIKGR